MENIVQQSLLTNLDIMKSNFNNNNNNNSSSGSGLVVRLPIRVIAAVSVSLPLGAFLVCIYLSLRYNFDMATATHCGVSCDGYKSLCIYYWRDIISLSLSFIHNYT